jgi:hypothetical protein
MTIVYDTVGSEHMCYDRYDKQVSRSYTHLVCLPVSVEICTWNPPEYWT